MHQLSSIRARFTRSVDVSSFWHGTEHRRPHRLKDGAKRACPGCGGVLEFREAYRIWRMERNTLEPAWVCYSHACGYKEFVRR